ncbi:HGGxSTG domain-containing protein [Aeromonas salmonicida]|uniref:HGGxSTG domain-containing protein n=1 Tax=Aeromonas salmonicida TaxID=645 RepID=UPI003D263862
MACGAKTRAGPPCKRTDIYGNGRCKFHGGMSIGTTAEEGKAGLSPVAGRAALGRWRAGN